MFGTTGFLQRRRKRIESMKHMNGDFAVFIQTVFDVIHGFPGCRGVIYCQQEFVHEARSFLMQPFYWTRPSTVVEGLP